MKITANMVTIARIVLMPIPGYLLYGGASELFAALIAIIVIGVTDWIDGIMARREGPSVLGGLLDPIADKIFIAVIYLPLTEQGVIPVWMTACIFSRDFVVTALRTSLSLRDAPMRTSTIAKYKTAMQMVGIGYVVLYLTHADTPDSPWVWWFIIGPIALPLSLILYRLVKRTKQGARSWTMVSLMTVAVGFRFFLGPDMSILVSLWIITAMTILSGVSYLADTWTALKGTKDAAKEIARFILDGLFVPIGLVLALGRYDSTVLSAIIIVSMTLELAVGGLGNLMGSEKIRPSFRWMTIKSVLLVGCCVAAIGLSGRELALPLGEASIVLTGAISLVYAVSAFWRRRAVYLSAI